MYPEEKKQAEKGGVTSQGGTGKIRVAQELGSLKAYFALPLAGGVGRSQQLKGGRSWEVGR